MDSLLIQVTLDTPGAAPDRVFTLQASPAETAGEFLRRVVQEFHLDSPPIHWELFHGTDRVPADATLGSLAAAPGPLHLVLRRSPPRPAAPPAPAVCAPATSPTPSTRPPAPSPVPLPPATLPRAGRPTVGAPANEFDLSLDDDEDDRDEVEATPQRRKTRTARQDEAYRATVRYYNRMNPDRVYPLLVLLTQEMVEKIVKQQTDQRASDPFRVDPTAAVEVEPVLPGCACYPPRQTVRLDGSPLRLTFHVVPHVLGPVTGAAVLVRQDHRTLAAVALDARVAQRTAVWLCGLLTFVLPFLSSVLRHFGLDFATQRQDGFSLYLALAQAVVRGISPAALTVLLGGVTAVLYWLTRPRTRDVFWDVTLVRPDGRREHVEANRLAGLDGAAEPPEPLRAPASRAVGLRDAAARFAAADYAGAVDAYDRALAGGPAEALDYARAAQAASRLGRPDRALAFLQRAEAQLPPGALTGPMLFNLACYHARLGHLDPVVPYLARAARAGYRTAESYRTDPDLAPVRGRPEFAALLDDLAAAPR